MYAVCVYAVWGGGRKGSVSACVCVRLCQVCWRLRVYVYLGFVPAQCRLIYASSALCQCVCVCACVCVRVCVCVCARAQRVSVNWQPEFLREVIQRNWITHSGKKSKATSKPRRNKTEEEKKEKKKYSHNEVRVFAASQRRTLLNRWNTAGRGENVVRSCHDPVVTSRHGSECYWKKQLGVFSA